MEITYGNTCITFLSDRYLTGNPCTEYEGYRKYVIATLPQLQVCITIVIHVQSMIQEICHSHTTSAAGLYCISGNFHVGLIFTDISSSPKSLKIHSAKNRHNDKSPFRAIQIAKIGLNKKILLLLIAICTKNSRHKKILYGFCIFASQGSDPLPSSPPWWI